MARALILAGLTIGVLVLYAFLAGGLVFNAWHCVSTACVVPTQRVATLISTSQGLVSAVVIAVLAISPKTGPLQLSFLGLPDGKPTQGIAIAYVVVWFLVGASALVVGHLIIDDDVAAKFQTLVDLGAAWFGLAIAAAYAFLGIKP